MVETDPYSYPNHDHPADQAGHKARSEFWRVRRTLNHGIYWPDKEPVNRVLAQLQRRQMLRDTRHGKRGK